MLENGIKRRKWFDKGLFNDDISDDEDDIAGSEDEGELDVSSGDEEKEKKAAKSGANKSKKANVGFVNPLKKSHLVDKADEINDEDVQFGSEDDYEDEDDHLHGKNS